MNFRLRDATGGDLGAINAIYNHYVMRSTCTYQEEPSTEAERLEWFRAHEERYPVLVAEAEDGSVVGWGSLNRFHPRSAYRFTVENSVYVREEWQRRGVGQTILRDLLRRAELLGYRNVLAIISADQVGSVTLHRREGFVECGLMKGVGFKFGRWLDVLTMQRVTAGVEPPRH